MFRETKFAFKASKIHSDFDVSEKRKLKFFPSAFASDSLNSLNLKFAKMQREHGKIHMKIVSPERGLSCCKFMFQKMSVPCQCESFFVTFRTLIFQKLLWNVGILWYNSFVFLASSAFMPSRVVWDNTFFYALAPLHPCSFWRFPSESFISKTQKKEKRKETRRKT